MSLPAISTAAYVYSTNQSAVQVSYADASTAIVYPNQFEDPRTQQLNAWVRAGGQITPYEAPPRPLPGPPQYISCAPAATLNGITNGLLITNWSATNSLGLTTDGTYVTLQAGRTYEITYSIGVGQMSAQSWMRFGIVNSAGGNLPSPGGDFQYNVLVWGLPPGSPSAQNEIPTNSFLYTPTVSTQVAVKCLSTSGGDITANLRPDFTSLVITEVVDESVYAFKQGPQGPAGPAGPVGPTGPAGPLGPDGPVGSTGATGATGPVGPSGPLGAAGPAGVAGPEGPEGPAGPQGQPGPGFSFQGTVATPQDLPDPADEGDAYTVTSTNTLWIYSGTQWNDAGVIQGPQGVQGTQGGVGATGPAGAQGPAGPAGPAGATGATGPAGATGPQGPAGSAGPTGATGAQGLTGPIGPAGPTGATGATGPAGPVGPQGPQGVQGATGPAGPAGSGTVQAGSWSGGMPQMAPGAWDTVQTINLPAGTTAYTFMGNLQWLANGGGGYGIYQTQVVVTNSTTGYNVTWSGSIANWRVINYMSYPTNGVVMGGASGLVDAGTYVVQLQVSGSYQDATGGNGDFQYVVTTW